MILILLLILVFLGKIPRFEVGILGWKIMGGCTIIPEPGTLGSISPSILLKILFVPPDRKQCLRVRWDRR
jgi:hypothetical protein